MKHFSSETVLYLLFVLSVTIFSKEPLQAWVTCNMVLGSYRARSLSCCLRDFILFMKSFLPCLSSWKSTLGMLHWIGNSIPGRLDTEIFRCWFILSLYCIYSPTFSLRLNVELPTDVHSIQLPALKIFYKVMWLVVAAILVFPPTTSQETSGYKIYFSGVFDMCIKLGYA